MTTLIDLSPEFIETLKVDPELINKKIAFSGDITVKQVRVTVELLDEGNTVPFISRYRKEKTDSLDEIKVRLIEQKVSALRNIETRKIEVIKSIFSQNALTNELFQNIKKLETLTEIEELYAPYKKKKKTKGMVAFEAGLGELAEIVLKKNKNEVDTLAVKFLNPEKNITSIELAIAGALDIIAEKLSQDVELRSRLKKIVFQEGFFSVEGKGDKEKSKYQIYYDFKEYFKNIKPHQILAINRGENEEELKTKGDIDSELLKKTILQTLSVKNDYLIEAVDDSLKRLIIPSIIREIKNDIVDSSEKHSIEIFSKNLQALLMQPPIKKSRILSIDPGLRTGSKCAVIDENGTFVDYFVVYSYEKEKAEDKIFKSLEKHKIQLIAIGNGTGSTEVQELVASALEKHKLSVFFTIVPEDGASVYSASPIASQEFPDLDLTIRGAISIGRRLQDPLAELVKIDPKAIGVGLYQHDLNQKALSESLDDVVESVVNNIGVNLNTSSVSLLKYVSGINNTVAQNIVKYREENGTISSRKELKKIAGIGKKVFEQCAGFIMVPESNNDFDNSWIHPENYDLAKEIKEQLKKENRLSSEGIKLLSEKYKVEVITINDVREALEKKRLDPRENYPQPILQKGVTKFEDLKVGMFVKGKVKNIVDFGAFIDVGLKETALVHISEISNNFIKSPFEVLKVGDVLELKIIGLDLIRKRISLSLKQK